MSRTKGQRGKAIGRRIREVWRCFHPEGGGESNSLSERVVETEMFT